MKSQNELKDILNTVEFGSDEWEKASEELHLIRSAEADKAQDLGKDWCCGDGEWWI